MSDPFVGEIKMFAGNFAPRNFAFCTGQIMKAQQNQALFAILGTTYGGDLKQFTFALPDFSGRMPVGTGTTPLPGGSSFSSSDSGGAETVELGATNMPTHNHQFQVFLGKATASSIQGAPPAGVRNPFFLPANAVTSSDVEFNMYSADLENTSALNFNAITAWGTNSSTSTFAIRNPYLTVGFIICTSGQMCFRP